MHIIKRTGFSIKNRWSSSLKSHNGLCCLMATKWVSDVGLGFSSMATGRTWVHDFAKRVVLKPGCRRSYNANDCITKEVLAAAGTPVLFRGQRNRNGLVRFQSSFQLIGSHGANMKGPCFARAFASTASEQERRNSSETRKDISTVEDPFDAPTYNIPEKPVTFTEGASYSIIILAGLGIAAAAGYGVFKELIFQPKEYKIFGKALERVQNDNQVSVRIGSPVTGYGQESRNRAARQRIPNRIWNDEDGVEHVEVNFYIRGPRGAGKVYTEMFRDMVDKQWKFTYLIVEIKSPSPAQLILESYVPP
ncbi:probable mitochondrial import inner membrane translocase subunit TIM21 isoform X1 [Camellia sinensis]|uniref:probable mitochondrial import inner membrane translocase subunit TIM21 isoform X1 n=1 Tax=Camellia sinensis TaxID=4442 RepID=UPI0010364B46|nr:probable mitochondrial import inner membrane translocase subunit TIM21 isoform X1 [Camellia sinensis]XP_028083199.1 probable mitochondrial import inner membrane translocase subunit TIM21 isoform X1 [Camellia sinensis]XP_028083200.1 probable mitochondrial import inner membrane translocase subunit TIM21 isoform X1 [Camellia sinensis]XP_028083201.1 probable mitochondrial import inner membrane translocase subunit TIM21 isoform X1 [Camellia sinensis]